MRHPRPKNMAITRLNILQHVLTILDIRKEGQKILLDHGISTVRNLLNAIYKAYQCLLENGHSKLFAVYKDQIPILRAWYQDTSRKNSIFKGVEIMDNLTETEYYCFCNRYIGQKTHNTSLDQKRMGSPYSRQEPKLKFPLK